MPDHDLIQRIEQLEAEVRALRDRAPAASAAQEAPEALSRRRLLRGAGLAAAGAAGALASPALTGRAAAANGDPVTLGAANTATAETSVSRTSGTGPALRLANSGDGAPLRIGESVPLPATVDAGDVMFSEGYFSVGWDPGFAAVVYESSFASYPVLFTPWRLLDTRYAAENDVTFGRSRVTNPSGKFDAAGRLKSGSTIDVRLDDFSFLARGVIANFAVTGPLNAGYLRVWDTSAPMPNASILNYAKGQTIANGVTTAMGFDALDRDSITIGAFGGATHVIVDLGGLVISDPLASSVPFAANTAGRRAASRRR